MKVFTDQLQSAKQELRDELDSLAIYMQELEDKVYKANKTSLELLKQIRDDDEEIETLKRYIIDLKSKIAVYIPVKDDPIDQKVAEYINNYPDRQRLKVMFMRESSGVYEFGSRRVGIKVDKDRISVRVGGGYLSIDEFLDQYTPVELQKLERKDPMRRFNERVAIQKTLVNRAVRETSPTDGKDGPRSRSPEMSSTMMRT